MGTAEAGFRHQLIMNGQVRGMIGMIQSMIFSGENLTETIALSWRNSP
jgi:hypothetical protein